MLASLLDDKLRPLAEAVRLAAERGADLTRRLLAFGRRQMLEPRPTSVTQLLAGMEPLMRRTLGEHIEIELRHDADLWSATVDPGQLENAVLNLAVNARDAMPNGGKLTIETANVELDADQDGATIRRSSPGTTSWSRSATPAPACRRRSSRAPSSPSSPPRMSARAPGSA